MDSQLRRGGRREGTRSRRIVAAVRRDFVRLSAVWETRVKQLRAVIARGASDGVTAREGRSVVEVVVVGALNKLDGWY